MREMIWCCARHTIDERREWRSTGTPLRRAISSPRGPVRERLVGLEALAVVARVADRSGAGADGHVAVGQRRHPAAHRARTGRPPRSSRRARARFGSCDEVEVFPARSPGARSRAPAGLPGASSSERGASWWSSARRSSAPPRRAVAAATPNATPDPDDEERDDRARERPANGASGLGRDPARARATSAASASAYDARCRPPPTTPRHAIVSSRPRGSTRPDREPRHERDHAGNRDRDREHAPE